MVDGDDGLPSLAPQWLRGGPSSKSGSSLTSGANAGSGNHSKTTDSIPQLPPQLIRTGSGDNLNGSAAHHVGGGNRGRRQGHGGRGGSHGHHNGLGGPKALPTPTSPSKRVLSQEAFPRRLAPQSLQPGGGGGRPLVGSGKPDAAPGGSGGSLADGDGAWGHASHATTAGGYSNFDRARDGMPRNGPAAVNVGHGSSLRHGGNAAGGGRGRHGANAPPLLSPRRSGGNARRHNGGGPFGEGLNGAGGHEPGGGGGFAGDVNLGPGRQRSGCGGAAGQLRGAASWEFDEEERPRRLQTASFSPRTGLGPLSPTGRAGGGEREFGGGRGGSDGMRSALLSPTVRGSPTKTSWRPFGGSSDASWTSRLTEAPAPGVFKPQGGLRPPLPGRGPPARANSLPIGDMVEMNGRSGDRPPLRRSGSFGVPPLVETDGPDPVKDSAADAARGADMQPASQDGEAAGSAATPRSAEEPSAAAEQQQAAGESVAQADAKTSESAAASPEQVAAQDEAPPAAASLAAAAEERASGDKAPTAAPAAVADAAGEPVVTLASQEPRPALTLRPAKAKDAAAAGAASAFLGLSLGQNTPLRSGGAPKPYSPAKHAFSLEADASAAAATPIGSSSLKPAADDTAAIAPQQNGVPAAVAAKPAAAAAKPAPVAAEVAEDELLPASEEAFLRSLGWTDCTDEFGGGLTDLEVAAFRARQGASSYAR